MKHKVTKKQIKDNYNIILSVGYCELQNLLRYKKPFAYSSGVYGWSCDYYNMGNVCISTGYNPIGVDVGYNLTKHYNDKAGAIAADLNKSYDDKAEEINNLLNQFIKEITNL